MIWAASSGHLAAVDALLVSGARMDFKNVSRQSAEMLALDNGHEAVVERLRQAAIIEWSAARTKEAAAAHAAVVSSSCHCQCQWAIIYY